MNMPLQGTASDVIKLAMIKVFNRINEEKLNSKLILQIHDELIVDAYQGEEEKVKQILKEEMESAYISTVHLDVSIGEGENLFDTK
jgi:DNA polymerase-1